MSIKSIGYEMNIKQEDDCEVEWISEGAMIFRCRCIDLKKVDAGK